MKCCRRSVSSASLSFTNQFTTECLTKSATLVSAAFLLAAVTCFAQDVAPTNNPSPSDQSSSQQTEPSASHTVTLPPGTHLALVLTQPIQSRYVRRGDDIYAQITDPVDSDNEVVIPPGTFVQGKVDKIDRRAGRGELHLASMAITFPDGYVAPIAGPMTLRTSDGYAFQDPGPRRGGVALAMAFGGAGIGALIGHSVGSSSSVQTTTLPPGCTGPPPYCLSSSMTVPGRQGIDTGIGAVVGGAAGGISALALLVTSHHFFMGAGAPVEMTLERPLTLDENEVAKAVRDSGKHPVAVQPVAPPPVPVVLPDSTSSSTCWTPGTPGTPPTVIPGAPGPDGIPGPPTIIPGTPGTPGTPYPCP
jgi:hypothetical protein